MIGEKECGDGERRRNMGLKKIFYDQIGNERGRTRLEYRSLSSQTNIFYITLGCIKVIKTNHCSFQERNIFFL